MRQKKQAFWLIMFAISLGCTSNWSSPPPSSLSRLPLPKLAPDSVVLEVAFVKIPKERVDFSSRFWSEADEQDLPMQLRRCLASNGFRAGLVGAPPPLALQEILDQEMPVAEAEGERTIDPGKEVRVQSRRLRSRAGHDGKIIISGKPIERLAALFHDPDGQVRGESLDQAQAYLSIRSFPSGDGNVRVELIPVIEHGENRTRFVGQQGAWAIDNMHRPAKTFNELKIDTVLTPGQSIAISCTDPPCGLGEQFFATSADDEDAPQLLLLVRLQQTQLDDRFDDELAAEPVATVVD